MRLQSLQNGQLCKPIVIQLQLCWLFISIERTFTNYNIPGLQIFKTITTAAWFITVGDRLFAEQNTKWPINFILYGHVNRSDKIRSFHLN